MTRVTLTPLANLSNGTTATTTINNNSQTINATFDRVLWNDGTAPNQMQAVLDMNSNQIINLPPPATMNSPARLVDVASNPTIVVPGTGTSGHLVPFLDGTNTWAGSGSNTYNGAVTVNGTFTTTGTVTMGANTLNGSALSNNTVTSTQLAANTVGNGTLALMNANTIKGNNSGGSSQPVDLTVPQVAAMLSAPNVQSFSSGSGTYSTPANTKYIIIEMCGAGAGGSGSGATAGSGGNGGTTTFGSSLLTCTGGNGGVVATSGLTTGGTATGGNIYNYNGDNGGTGMALVSSPGGPGGTSFFGGSGTSAVGSVGGNASAPGSGGAGGGEGASTTAAQFSQGGAAGAFIKHIITSPAGSYPYAIGGGGGGGTAGTSGFAGGSGFNGVITVYAYFQ